MADFQAIIKAILDTSGLQDQLDKLRGTVKVDVDAGSAEKGLEKVNKKVGLLQKTLNFGSVAALTAKSIQLIGKASHEAVQSVKDIDKALTELKKVTDETDATYKNLLSGASSDAKKIGTTISGLVKSTADFSRLGYNFTDSQKLAKVANIYAVVGDEVNDTDVATSHLVSTMAAFKIGANDAITIIDKYNEVSNNFAISSGGIGSAIERSGSSLAAANNTLDESIALITAANTVVQNPEAVGTAFKTMSMRIRGAKTELEAAGLDTDGMAKSVSSLREEMLALSGVDIMLDDNTFKSTYQIMDELSAKWKELTDIQQASITELIAGKRQGNIVSSLMENFDIARSALKTSLDSEGSAMSEHAKWLDHIEAKTNQLKASFQSLSMDTLSADLVGGLIDGATAITSFLDKTNLLKDTLAGLAVFGTIKGFTLISAGIADAAMRMNEFNAALNMVKTGSVAGNQLQQLAQLTANLSQSQLKAVLSSQALTTQQRIAILSAQGLSTSQAQVALGAMGLASAEGVATASTITLGGAIKGLWATLAANPLVLITLGIVGAVKAYDALTESFEEAQEKAAQSKQAYKTTASEVESLNSELKTTRERLDELQSKQDNGTITLVEQDELEKLTRTNEQLNNQLEIKTKLAELQQGQAAKDAANVLTKQQIYMDNGSIYGANGKYNTRNIIEETSAKQEELNSLQENYNQLLGEQAKKDPGTRAYKKLESRIESTKKRMDFLTGDIADNLQIISDNYSSLFAADGSVLPGYESIVQQIDQLIDFTSGKSARMKEAAQTLKDAFFDNLIGNGTKGNLAVGLANDFAKWIDGLSDEDLSKAFEISLNTDTADWTLEQWQNALEGSASETADAVKEVSYALDDVKTRTQEYIDQQSTLQSAFSGMNSATGMTAEEISKVSAEFQKLKNGFDPSILFETTAHGVRMNTEAFKAYNQQLQAQNKTDILEAIILKQKELNALEANDPGRAALESEIQQLGLLASQYDAVTSKYNAYVNATSSANNRDSFANVASGYSAVQALLEQGWVSDDSVTSYLDLMLGDNWRTDFADAKSAFGSLSESANEFGHSLKDYMTFDKNGNLTSQGVWTFAEDAAKLGFGSIEGNMVTLDLTGDKIDELAAKFGTTAEFIELMGRALADAGMDITFDPPEVMDYKKALREIDKQATESREKLEQLQEQAENGVLGEVNLDYDAASMSIDEILSKITELKDARGKLSMETDAEAINALDAEIANLEDRYILLKIGAYLDDGGTIEQLQAMDGATLQQTLELDTSQVDTAAEKIKNFGAEKAEIPVTVKLDESQFNALTGTKPVTIEATPVVKGEVKIPDSTVNVTAVVESAPEVPDTTVTADVVIGNSPAVVPDATGIVNFELGSSPEEVPDAEGTANFELGKHPTTAPSISGVANYNSARYNYSMTAPTIYGKAVYTKEYSGGGGRAAGTMVSIAHADGTAYNVANLQSLTPSHAGGKVALEHDETALTNEVGQESLVRNGVWYLLPPGPHMEHLKKGDIVFSAKQTEDLLKAGKTSTYARALADGTLAALTNGTVHAYGYGGFGSNPWASAGTGASGTGGSVPKGSVAGSNSSKKEEEPQKIDWIEIALNRIQTAIDKIKVTAESAFKSISKRLSASGDEVAAITHKMSIAQKAYDRYMREAYSTPLPDGAIEAIIDGAIDITEYDSETAQNIQKATEWVNKAKDAEKEIVDLENEINEIYKGRFDTINTHFENQAESIENRIDIIQTQMDNIETKGYFQSSKLYGDLAKQAKDNISLLTEQKKSLEDALNEAMLSGSIEQYSEAWYEMNNAIDDVKKQIIEANSSLIEYQKSLRELNWDIFDYGLERISEINDEADFLIDLMSKFDMVDENGQFSDIGNATIGLHAQNYSVFMAKSQKYAEEIKKLDAEIANDPYNKDLIERREELLDLQQESILSAEQEKQAVADLAKEGLEKQIAAMKELADSYYDALDSAKSLHDYQEKISDQAEKRDRLQKLLSAYQDDVSEETRSKVQKLQVELKEAEEKLADEEYDKYISDQKKMLDNFYSEYEAVMNERIDNVDVLMENMIATSNENCDEIISTIEGIAGEVGYAVSDNLKNIWEGSADPLSYFDEDFKETVTAANDILNDILMYVAEMAGHSNNVKAYKSGGYVNYTGVAHVDGTPSKPESFLDAADTKNIGELKDYLRKLGSEDIKMLGSTTNAYPQIAHVSAPQLTYLPKIPDAIYKQSSPKISVSQNNNFDIQIDHVEDYNDFVHQLINDRNFEKAIQSMTIDRTLGGSRLDKYRYDTYRK